MSFWHYLWFLLILVIATCHPARAQTCAPDPTGKFVICEREGFDRAIKKCSDGIGDAAACKVKLDAALKSWDDLKVKYDRCLADIPPPPSVTKPVMGYLTGLAGLGAIVLAPTLESSTGTKWGVSIGGTIMVVAGLWAVLPQ